MTMSENLASVAQPKGEEPHALSRPLAHVPPHSPLLPPCAAAALAASWEDLLSSPALVELAKKANPAAIPPSSPIAELRLALQSRVCESFSALRLRLGALFRNGGLCERTFDALRAPANAPEAVKQANAALISRSQQAGDICDVILTMGEHGERGGGGRR